LDSRLSDLFYNVGEKIIGYLPNLLGGILVLALGWLLGWLAKRLVVQVCVIFKLHRLAQDFRWGQGLLKADLRHAVYGFLGNLAFLVIFIVFVENALNEMNLTSLSRLLDVGISFIPRFLGALFIFGAGWLISSRISAALLRDLLKETVPRASLIARFVKVVFILFFSAMALVELNIAREAVIIGFSTFIVTLALLAIVFSIQGGRSIMQKLLGSNDE
jgi:hypothetical protein